MYVVKEEGIIYTLAFTGGFVIMSLELLGGRVMAPYFGSSIYVWGSIITTFMLSLAFGYLWGGRLSLKEPSLRKFGLIFFIAAFTMYPLTLISDDVMNIVFNNIHDPRYGSLAASIILFTIPTIILGMISPYSVRLLVKTTHSSGQTAGKLYFASTLGSALGTLMTSFYLVLWFEMFTILRLLTITLLVLGLIGVLTHWKNK
ncbi:MAG: glycosyl transferase [Gammaproteobacteria bacterium]|nr:glycosyl transferase [Gammaproteobacteria bacterium]